MADGVTQCKFESTYAASDECVLHSILDVLVAAVGCPAGGLLTNDNLINIFQVGAASHLLCAAEQCFALQC